MFTPAERKKKTSLVYNSSCRTVKKSMSRIQRGSHSSRHTWSSTVSPQDSRVMDRIGNRAPRQAVRVLDDDGRDVTPLPLYQTEPRETQSKPGRYFLDEIFSSQGSELSKSTSSFNLPCSSSFLGSSRLSSLSKASLTNDTEDSVLKLEMPTNMPAHMPAAHEEKRPKDNVKQHITEEMLDEVVNIFLSETDTISLLDIPSTCVSHEADNAEALKKRNTDYAELCKNKMGNDKYVTQAMQILIGAPKHKQVQSDKIATSDAGICATVWDIYDSFQNEAPESEMADHADSSVSTSKGPERRGEKSSSSSSTIGTGSTISSLLEMEVCGSSLSAEPDLQQVMLSDTFQHSLLIMERTITVNILQSKLAAYKQLPILEDPASMMNPEEFNKEDEKNLSPPAMEYLWEFSCELTRGRCVTSMTWNKKNPDLLAVGYGDSDSTEQKGLICCWSLKNFTWPERVFQCHSGVTSLDFSVTEPDQLAVGMFDGTVAIYSVQSRVTSTCLATSSECLNKHMYPVWQVTWTKHEMSLSGEDKGETLISVSSDGRITSWFICNNSLNCRDLMELRRIQLDSKMVARSKKAVNVLSSAVTPGLCVDFHPTNSSIYLAGTWEGAIHKCSFSNNQQYLDTYHKHTCPVNHIEWSPFSPDLFLSCSSDWTIRLWKQDSLTPLLEFTSTQRAVDTVRWSPNWSSVFAAVNGQQVEIWDLNSCLMDPTIVHHAAPGVQMTSLLFARGKDCILVGDTNGQVTFYELKNLNVGEGKQVDSLEDIINSAVST